MHYQGNSKLHSSYRSYYNHHFDIAFHRLCAIKNLAKLKKIVLSGRNAVADALQAKIVQLLTEDLHMADKLIALHEQPLRAAVTFHTALRKSVFV